MKSLTAESKKYYLFFNFPIQLLAIISIFFVENISLLLISFLIFYILVYWVGIQAGYHKMISHKLWVPKNKIIFNSILILGCLGLMGGPLSWALIHRTHHYNTDTDKDPHTPKKGIFHSYILWLFKINNDINFLVVKDLLKIKSLIFINKNCKIIVLVILSTIFAINYDIFSGLLLACTLTFHSEMCINAFFHKHKNGQPEIINNSYLSWITGGASLHKNHHENFNLCNFKLSKGQLDGSYLFIKLLKQ